MKEMVTIDGKQFELTTEYPLTEQQRQQTILDIRKQTGCSSYNKTQSLDGSIQTLATSCINVTVVAPATIIITNITIVGGFNIICPTVACSSVTRTVNVTFENSGDLPGDVTPTLTVNSVAATGTPPGLTTIPAKAGDTNGIVTVYFSGVTLGRGSNQICAGPA